MFWSPWQRLGGSGRREEEEKGHPERLRLSLSFQPSPLPPSWVSARETEGLWKGTGLGRPFLAGQRSDGMTEAHAPAEDSLRRGGQSHSLGPGAKASSLPLPSLKGLSCAENSTRSLCPSSWPRGAWMACASFFIRTQWEVGVRGRTRCHNLQGPLQNDTWCLCFR